MSIINLDIDEALKMRLSLLLNEFESYRISNIQSVITEPVLSETKIKEIKEKKNSFFQRFFFSDF